LLVTAEDNYANTVGPRAVAAGVDLTALIYLKGLVRSGKHELFLLSSGYRSSNRFCSITIISDWC
jgi:hypothetical protein